MAIEIVDFPTKNGDFPWQNVSSPEGKLGCQCAMKTAANQNSRMNPASQASPCAEF